MSRYLSTPALVINKKTIKESDSLVTLLTPQHGKIVAIAKGIRNIRSQRLGNLQLGNVINANIYTKNDRMWISETENIRPFLQKNKTLTQLNLLFYLLEILNSLIAENQLIENVYPIALSIIRAIDRGAVPEYIDNEIKLISVLGFGVPQNITTSYKQKDYKQTQKLLKQLFESITEKRLESNKLFS